MLFVPLSSILSLPFFELKCFGCFECCGCLSAVLRRSKWSYYWDEPWPKQCKKSHWSRQGAVKTVRSESRLKARHQEQPSLNIVHFKMVKVGAAVTSSLRRRASCGRTGCVLFRFRHIPLLDMSIKRSSAWPHLKAAVWST